MESTSESLKGLHVKVIIDAEQLKRILDWAKHRLEAECANRPDCNIHKRTLTETWHQVIRKLEFEIDLQMLRPYNHLLKYLFECRKERKQPLYMPSKIRMTRRFHERLINTWQPSDMFTHQFILDPVPLESDPSEPPFRFDD